MSVSYLKSTNICEYLILHPAFMVATMNGVKQHRLTKLLGTVQRIGHLRAAEYERQILVPPGNKQEKDYLAFALQARKELADAVMDEKAMAMSLDDVVNRVGRQSPSISLVVALYDCKGNAKDAMKVQIKKVEKKLYIPREPETKSIGTAKFHGWMPRFARYSNR